MYFTMGQGGQLFGVNLTSKKVVYTKDFRGNGVSGLYGAPSGTVIVQMGNINTAFDAKGNYLWSSDEFTFTTRANAYLILGNKLYIASDSQSSFFVVDLTTGLTVGDPMPITAGNIYPNGLAALTILNSTTNIPVVTGFQLPAMTQLFAIPNVVHYLTANDDFFLVTNVSNGATQVLVYDRSTMALINTLHAMEGVYASGFTPVISANFGLFMVGTDVIRLLGIDLLNGYIHYEIYLGNEPGTFIQGTSGYVTISKTNLQVIDLNTGKVTLSISNVPYTSTHTIVSLGNDLIQVINLQGYTTWNIKTGAFVSSNEMSPGFNPAASYNWNGLSVYTLGAAVVVSS